MLDQFGFDGDARLTRAAKAAHHRDFPDDEHRTELSLVWGVHCVVAEDAHDQDDMVERACRIAFKEGFAKAGQRVIIVAGVPLGTPGATNMIRVAFVGSQAASDG